jgi:hypothetical protein
VGGEDLEYGSVTQLYSYELSNLALSSSNIQAQLDGKAGPKSYSLISTTSLSGSSEVTITGLEAYSSVYIGVGFASTSTAGSFAFRAEPYSYNIWSRTEFRNSSTWSYQNIGGALSSPGNNQDIYVASAATPEGNISASLMIDGVSSNGGKYFSWQSGEYIYSGESNDAGAWFSNGQGVYLHTQPITGITIASSSTFDGGTVYVYGSLK